VVEDLKFRPLMNPSYEFGNNQARSHKADKARSDSPRCQLNPSARVDRAGFQKIILSPSVTSSTVSFQAAPFGPACHACRKTVNTGCDILVTIGAQVCLHHKFEACFVEGSTSLKIVHATQPAWGSSAVRRRSPANLRETMSI
jgi:hypothetical protein